MSQVKFVFNFNDILPLICLTHPQLLLDTSALIRLKLASEYGYGANPAAILTDKVNLLGSGALPFWRWLEGSCRTPAGLGKIQVILFLASFFLFAYSKSIF